MARFKEILYGSVESKSDEHELECYANDRSEIYIKLDCNDGSWAWVCLDIPTAIKLNKVLRREINTIKEEVTNE